MKKEIFLWSALSIVFLFVYSPVYLFSYAHHDDYGFLVRLPETYDNFIYHDFLIFLGRYVGAWMFTLYGWLVSDLDDLKIIRFLSLAQCVISAGLIMGWLNRWYKPFQSFCIVIMMFTLPSFQIMVACSAMGPYMSAVLFSILAAIYTDKSESALILPIALLFTALCIYPSGAMFYWVLVGIRIFSVNPFDLFKHKRMFFAGLTAVGLYAGIVKLIYPFVRQFDFRNYSVDKINLDILGKLKWFLQEPLMNVINLWNIFPNKVISSVFYSFIILMFVVGMIKIIQKSKHGKDGLREVGYVCLAILILLVLSYLPGFVAMEKTAQYRCLSGLGPLILMMVLFLIRSSLSVSLIKKAGNIFLLTGAVIGCLYGHYNIMYYRVMPSYLELNYLKQGMNVALKNGNHLHVICPRWNFEEDGRYDEFVIPTSYWPVEVLPMVITNLKSFGRENGFKMKNYIPDDNGIVRAMFFDKNQTELNYSLSFSVGYPEEELHGLNNTVILNLDSVFNPKIGRNERQSL